MVELALDLGLVTSPNGRNFRAIFVKYLNFVVVVKAHGQFITVKRYVEWITGSAKRAQIRTVGIEDFYFVVIFRRDI